MKRIYAGITALTLLMAITFWSSPVRTQTQAGPANAIGVNSNITQIGGVSVNTDPCGSWGIVKQSAFANITTAATTALVPVSGSTAIFVCGYNILMSGATVSADSIQFEQGTGAACAGAPTALTPTFSTGIQTANSPIALLYGGGEMTIFKTASSNGLCAVTTVATTAPTIAVLITYVQQ